MSDAQGTKENRDIKRSERARGKQKEENERGRVKREKRKAGNSGAKISPTHFFSDVYPLITCTPYAETMSWPRILLPGSIAHS